MATQQGIVKNLLIKDSSGNTQMIEVVQTAPGKFVTASGHSIKTAVAGGAGGTKTVLRAVPATATVQTQQQPQFLIAASGAGTLTPTQIIRTSTVASAPTTIIKGAQGNFINTQGGRQVLTIPMQAAGGLTSAAVLKAANIKTEVGTPIIQQQRTAPLMIGNAPVLQVIQAGNQRLLVTQGGSQVITTASLTGQQHQGLPQQLATIMATATADPNAPGGSQQITAASLAPTLNFSKQNFISPILDHTGARKRADFPSDVSYESKRRKAEKGGKGLRHFSMKVCEKVRTKGITTYNEVADELVQEFASPNASMSSIEQQFDQKNIRRRVYDALNVLMAMNIISKEKKEIKWLGLPTNSMQECTTLEKDRQKRMERLKTKTQQLHDLIIQQVAFKSLVEKNKEREKESGPPPPHGSIHLPFLIVNTEKNTVIDCSISNDKMEYLFNFDGTFEIHDDIEVLKRMGLALGLDKGECSDDDIARAKRVLPKALEMYIDQISRRDVDWRAEFGDDLEEAYYHDGEPTDENTENVFEVTGASALGLSGLNSTGDFSMSVEELEMQAAMEALHGHDDDDTQDHNGDEDAFEDEDDEDGLGG